MMNAFNPKFSRVINRSPIGSPGGIALNKVRKERLSLRDELGLVLGMRVAYMRPENWPTY